MTYYLWKGKLLFRHRFGQKLAMDPACCCCCCHTLCQAWLQEKCLQLDFTGDIVGTAVLNPSATFPNFVLLDTVELPTPCATADGFILLTTAEIMCNDPPATGIKLLLSLVPYPAVALYCTWGGPYYQPTTVNCGSGSFTAEGVIEMFDFDEDTPCPCTNFTITTSVIDCPA